MQSTARSIAVDAAKPKAAPATWHGTVTSVSDGQVLVTFPGSASATPCAAEVKCVVGDVVAVEVRGHSAVVTANATHPVTDDELAQLAAEVAAKAKSTIDRYKEVVSRIFLTEESYNRTNEEMRSNFRKVFATGQAVKDVYSTISQTAERIMTEVGASYYIKGETNTIVETVSTRVTQTEASVSTLVTAMDGMKTLIRDFSGGTLVAKVSQAIGALTNADGSFDVVKLQWSDETPSVEETYSTLGLRKLIVGNVQAMGAGILHFVDGALYVGKSAGTYLRLRQSVSGSQKWVELGLGGTAAVTVDGNKKVETAGELDVGSSLTSRGTVSQRAATTFRNRYESSISTQIGDAVTDDTVIDSERVYDSESTNTYYSQIMRRHSVASSPSDAASATFDELYKSFVLQRKNAAGDNKQNGFYLHLLKDGTPTVTFTSGGAAAWRKGLVGHDEAAWTYLAGDSSNGVRYRCIHGFVHIEVLYGSGAGIPASGSKTFGTMPEGFRPGRQITGASYVSSNNVSCLWVETSGAVKGSSQAGTAQSTFYGFVEYPVV
jgi:hypothetical protein